MRRLLLLLLMAALIIPAIAEAQFPITVRQGDDSWVTPGGGSTFVTFNSPDLPPLPAGFFGLGSQPFNGTVSFRGQPLGTAPVGALGRADTLVRRLVDATFLSIPDTDTVPIQIRGLSLVGETPITVTFAGGGTQQWNVKLSLSTMAAQPIGNMTITLQCNDGGVFTSNLPVLPRFIFTRGAATRILDCGSGACNVTNLLSVNGCWQRLYPGSPFRPGFCNVSPLPPGVNVDGNCDMAFDYTTIGRRDFLAGFDGCATPAGCRRCLLIEQHPDGAVHTVDGPTGCQDGNVVQNTSGSTSNFPQAEETDVMCPQPTGTSDPGEGPGGTEVGSQTHDG